MAASFSAQPIARLKPPLGGALSESATQRPITVLLIEDNAEQAELVKLSLAGESGSGYRVDWASNLMDGMKTLSEPGIDVVVLDLGLPELDGYKSHTAVHRFAPQVPIVVLTADERPASRELTLAAGAADYLIKGEVSDAQLRLAIRTAHFGRRDRGREPDPERYV
jgi:DNA-binding response OmpR family regulator